MHYARWRKHGDPLKVIAHGERRARAPASLDEVWRNVCGRSVKQLSGCWEYSGYRIHNGYGATSWHGKNVLAHRIAWQATHGEIPAGMFVCSDNVHDMRAKGREPGNLARQAS